ncbi:MAG: radical SAM family heme chaperone HemW [Pseudomonadota bacterium]
MKPLSIYFHWPFCVSKCPYCDFNVHVRERIDEERWAEYYVRALKYYAEMAGDRIVKSIYFGGGTPSLMSPSTVEAVITTVQKEWRVANDIEITIEANPTSVEVGKFEDFRSSGVNRVSLGVQALDDSVLQFFGRAHDKAQALKAIETAKFVFDRWNFDLIYARPDQSVKAWEKELKEALKYIDGHLSLYQLTIERNTPFYFDHAQGKFDIPEDALAAALYTRTQEILEEAGLPAYEVSNHAKPGEESIHNLSYWHYGEYIGIGPGAHGRLTTKQGRVATRDHHAPDIWLAQVGKVGHGHHPFTALDAAEQFMEALMLGLRLREGMDLALAADKAGIKNWRLAVKPEKIDTCVQEGWLTLEGSHLKASTEGWLRLNAMIPHILK